MHRMNPRCITSCCKLLGSIIVLISLSGCAFKGKGDVDLVCESQRWTEAGETVPFTGEQLGTEGYGDGHTVYYYDRGVIIKSETYFECQNTREDLFGGLWCVIAGDYDLRERSIYADEGRGCFSIGEPFEGRPRSQDGTFLGALSSRKCFNRHGRSVPPIKNVFNRALSGNCPE